MKYFKECMIPDKIDSIWLEGAILEVKGNETARRELISIVGVAILKGMCSDPQKCFNIMAGNKVVNLQKV
jgi:hypothetical protein